MKLNTDRQASPIFKLIFCTIFVLVPAAVSIIWGWGPIWYVTDAAWRRGSLIEVPAIITAVELRSTRIAASSSKKPKHSVVAIYRYHWQGVEHTSSQVTWPHIADTSADHNATLFNRLDAARNGDVSASAWVDPDRPTYAVLDKHMPWHVLVVAVPLAIVFGGIAALFSIVAFYMVRDIRRPA